jgi:FMN phosphatase YigB (HAD superfamily)
MSMSFTVSKILHVLKRGDVPSEIIKERKCLLDDEQLQISPDTYYDYFKEFNVVVSCKGDANFYLSSEQLDNIIQYSINKYQCTFLSHHIEFANTLIKETKTSFTNELLSLAKNIHRNVLHYLNDNNILNVKSIEITIKDKIYSVVFTENFVNYHNLESPILLFDLDDTLYTDKEILKSQVKLLTDECRNEYPYLSEETLMNYYTTYGSSYRGLQVEHQAQDENINRMMFKAYSQIDVSQIQFKPKLKELFSYVQQPCVVVSNAPQFYVERVLQQLQISKYFINIITPNHDNQWIFKHDMKYNELLNARFGIESKLIIFDDNKTNCDILSKRNNTQCVLINKDNTIEKALETYMDTPSN